MREVLRQYGTTIMVVIAALLIIGILMTITFNGSRGIVDIAGGEISNKADDNTITQTASEAELVSQSNSPIPILSVIGNPTATQPVNINDIFSITNTNDTVDLEVAQITTVLNDASTNVIGSTVTVDGKTMTFNEAGIYYLTVDIRQSNRKMTQTFKIVVDAPPVNQSASKGPVGSINLPDMSDYGVAEHRPGDGTVFTTFYKKSTGEATVFYTGPSQGVPTVAQGNYHYNASTGKHY